MLPLLKIGIIAAVIAVAAVGITIGIVYTASPVAVATDESCRNVGSLTQLRLLPIGDGFAVTWTAPTHSGQCNFTYDVHIYTNDEQIQEDNTDSTYYAVNGVLKPCSTLKAGIRVIHGTEYHGSMITTEYSTAIGDISSISIDNGLATWLGNTDLDNCKFQVKLNDDIVQSGQESATYDLASVAPCMLHEITVTPIHFNGTLGEPLTRTFEKEIPTVQDFRIFEENGDLVANWEHFHENCDISVRVGDKFHIYQDVVEATQILDSAHFTYCESNDVAIEFVSKSGQTGSTISYAFERALIIPNDLRLTQSSNSIIIVWNPTAYLACAVEITIDEAPAMHATPSDGVIVADIMTFEYCSEHQVNIVFTPLSQSPPAEKILPFTKTPEFPNDLHMETNKDTIRITWTDTRFEQCSCEIILDETTIIPTNPSRGDVEYDTSDLNHCTNHNVEIRFSDSTGENKVSDVLTFEKPAIIPDDLDIDMVADILKITWIDDTIHHCYCEITIDGTTSIPIDPSRGNVEVDVSNLNHCSDHEVRITFGDSESTVHDTRSFIIPPALPTDFTVEAQNDVLKITWSDTNVQQCDCEITIERITLPLQPSRGDVEFDISHLASCTDHVVEITFSSPSGLSAVSDTRSFAKPAELPPDFSVTPGDVVLSITWTDTTIALCNCKITVGGNSIDVEPFRGNVEFDISGLASCTDHIVEITFSSPTDLSAVSDTQSFAKPASLPSDLTLIVNPDNVDIRWTHTGLDACTILFKLGDDEILASISDGRAIIEQSEFEYCERQELNMKFLSPAGESAGDTTFKFRLFQIQGMDASLMSDDIVRIAWTLGAEAEICVVNYQWGLDCTTHNTIPGELKDYLFNDCPLNGESIFYMSIKPEFIGDDDDTYVVKIDCHYTVNSLGGNPELELNPDEENSALCPATITLKNFSIKKLY